jgi:hypothetical protein
MIAKRVLTPVTVAVVLLVAWYASREKLGMGIAVAILGLAATYSRGVLGIPAAVLMAAAALYVPGVVAVFLMLGVLYGLIMSDDSPQIQAYRFFGPGGWP